MLTIEDLIRESNHIEDVWDEQEVKQSLEAWQLLTENFLFITETAILLTHDIVMKNLWPEIAGNYRTVNVQVVGNGKVLHTPPHWLLVPSMVESWVLRQRLLDPIVAHVEFEEIHPFRDGNGRVGRLLLWFHQWLLGHVLTEITYEKRSDYYAWFANTG